MDIRDFNDIPLPEVEEGNKFLEKIYELQKQLIDHYIGIEGMPSYPVDVNPKSSQNLLKDFTGRIIEELAEGDESHLEALKIWDENHEFFMTFNMRDDGELDDDEKEICQKMAIHLQNLNEEWADAIHFMVELLVYINVQPEDIKGWILKNYPSATFENENDVIAMASSLGLNLITEDLYIHRGYTYPYHNSRRCDVSNPLTSFQKSFIKGGTRMLSDSDEQREESDKYLWRVTYLLSLSRNCLKNKPWKQTGVMTNETLYQSKVVEAFIVMMGYFNSLGCSSQDIFYLYCKKNLVNQFRIKSKY